MKASGKIVVVSLLAASAVAVATMIHGAGKFEWNGLYAWVTAPYLLLMMIFVLPVRQSEARSMAGALAAALVLVFTCLFYVDAMWFSVSSTSALVFVFMPMYLLVGGLIVWGLAWVLFRKRAGADTPRA